MLQDEEDAAVVLGQTLKSSITSLKFRSFALGELPPDVQVNDLHSTRIGGPSLPRVKLVRLLIDVSYRRDEVRLEMDTVSGEEQTNGNFELIANLSIVLRADPLKIGFHNEMSAVPVNRWIDAITRTNTYCIRPPWEIISVLSITRAVWHTAPG